nr:MAG TPA: hypothetical protein [Caudoviricetes sp.]
MWTPSIKLNVRLQSYGIIQIHHLVFQTVKYLH